MNASIDVLTAALRKAKPMTAPGTYRPESAAAVHNQYIGWRYAVVKMADALQAAHGDAFDRQAFNAACGTTN